MGTLADLLAQANQKNMLARRREPLDVPFDPMRQIPRGMTPPLKTGDVANMAIQNAPGIGDVASLIDAYKAWKSGDKTGGVLSGIAALPMVGAIKPYKGSHHKFDMSNIDTGEGASLNRYVVDDDGAPVVFFHGSESGVFDPSKVGGKFGGTFARQGKPSGYGTNQHKLLLNGKILELDHMAETLSDGKGRADLASVVGLQEDDDALDLVIESLTDGSHYPTDESVWSILGAIDEADAAVEIQKLRGRVAEKLGFDAVRTPDEFDGDTVMVLKPNVLVPAR
jgi:hypothetical protein